MDVEFQEQTSPEEVESTESSEQEESLATVGSEEEVQRKGPIPFEAHQKALENARKKAQEEAESRYSFLQGRDANEILEAIQLRDLYTSDPDAFGLYAAGRSPHLRDRILAQPAQTTKEPDYPQGVLDQYTGQYYYSADDLKKINEINEQKFIKRLESEVGPLKQYIQQTQTFNQEQQAAQAQIEEYATTLPYFDDYLEDILAEMNKDKRLNVTGAYKRVWADKIQPTIKRQERDSTMGALKKKAKASQDRPNSSTDASKGKKQYSRGRRGWDEVFEEVEAEIRS